MLGTEVLEGCDIESELADSTGVLQHGAHSSAQLQPGSSAVALARLNDNLVPGCLRKGRRYLESTSNAVCNLAFSAIQRKSSRSLAVAAPVAHCRGSFGGHGVLIALSHH